MAGVELEASLLNEVPNAWLPAGGWPQDTVDMGGT